MSAKSTIALMMLAFLVAALTACDDLFSEPEIESDEIGLEEIIDVVRFGTGALAADGMAIDTVLARLPGRATDRLVTFTTTAGLFTLTAAKEAKVRAVRVGGPDDPLEARIVLRADTVPTTAIVSGVVATYRDTVWIPIQ